MIGIEGNLPGLFAAGCFAVGIKAEGRKAVRKDVVGLEQRAPLPVPLKVPVAAAVPAVRFYALIDGPCDLRLFVTRVHGIVKHGNGPDMMSVETNDFIGGICCSIMVQ